MSSELLPQFLSFWSESSFAASDISFLYYGDLSGNATTSPSITSVDGSAQIFTFTATSGVSRIYKAYASNGVSRAEVSNVIQLYQLTTTEKDEIVDDVQSTLSASHGAGSWATATGFAVPGDAMDLITDAVDASSLATGAVVEMDAGFTSTHGSGAWTSATGFSTHSAADAADAVWDEALSGHTTSGTFGEFVGIILPGIPQANTYLDTPSFDASSNLTFARLRIYSDPTSVGGSGSVVATYHVSATYSGNELSTYRVTRQ